MGTMIARPRCQDLDKKRVYQLEEGGTVIQCISMVRGETGKLIFELTAPNPQDAETLMWDLYHGEYDGG